MTSRFLGASSLVLSTIFLSHGMPAGAQAVVAVAAESEASGGGDRADEIVVTGTRRANQTSAKSLAPIDVVDTEALAALPSSDLNDKLAASIPSFKVQRAPQADGVIFSRPATLRNLSPDQTLVLVNGKRRHRSAFVDVVNQGSQPTDLSQIPAAAIGHVEVLRDGASAQYGSDAIAGVINILLDNAPGTVLTAQAGQYYAGDGFGVEVTGRSGLVLPGGGTLSVSGDYSNSNPTDRSAGLRYRVGQPEAESYHATYNLKLPLGDAFGLYSFGTYGNMSGWSDFTYRDPNGDPAYARSFYQNGQNAIFPNWTLTTLYPNGFVPEFGAAIKDAELVAGIEGELADGLNLDVSGSYGRNAINYRVRNSVNVSLGPLSPTRFDAGEVIESETSANVDLTYRLDTGLVRPVNVAFGGAFRHERFETIAGDVASYAVGPLSDLPTGARGFPGLTPEAAGVTGRDNVSAYLDVEADLTEQLTLGAAGRYEHFSDFGSNFSYKLAGRYQFTPAIAARATYNTGFHAPAPGQQAFTKVTAGPDSTKPAPYPITTTALVLPTDALAAPFGGNALTPEKSRNVSAGLVLQPAAGLTLTVDYYHIAIRDRIGLSPQFALLPGAQYDKIQFLVNAYDTRTDGIDAVLSWSHDLWSGRLSLTGAYDYNRTRISRADPVLVNHVTRPYIEDSRPRHTAIATATYDGGPLHLLGRVRYYGSFIDAIPFDQTVLGFQNQKVSPRAFVDLSLSYDVLQGTQVTVGAENLLGTYPERATGIVGLIGNKYPYIRPYEEDGGRWYVRLTQRF